MQSKQANGIKQSGINGDRISPNQKRNANNATITSAYMQRAGMQYNKGIKTVDSRLSGETKTPEKDHQAAKKPHCECQYSADAPQRIPRIPHSTDSMASDGAETAVLAGWHPSDR